MANLSMSLLFLDHEDEEEIASSSDDVTHPVTQPPQPLNEGHEADVDELVANLSNQVIASESSSSVSFNVIPPSPTLTDAFVGELVTNLSDDVISLETSSSSVTYPVNESHETDVGEVVANLPDDVIASENTSSVSVMVNPLSPTLTDAIVANLSDDVTSLDASSSVSCPVTPPSQPLTEALVVANLDNGGDEDPILAVADDCRGGGGSSRRGTVFLDGEVSDYSVGIKIGDYINRHVDDEDQCDDADDNDDYHYDDLDDDLIPRRERKKVNGDRMRKTAKRALTKPRCVYGKYGLSI